MSELKKVRSREPGRKVGDAYAPVPEATTLDRLRQFAEREVGEGTIGLIFNPDRKSEPWSFAAEYGREAPDSPMAGAATYGSGDTPEAAIEEGLAIAGYGPNGRRVNLPTGSPDASAQRDAASANEPSES